MPVGRFVAVTLALAMAALSNAGCGTTVTGRPNAAPSNATPAGPATEVTALESPPDGSGFSTEPLDQPNPAPGITWAARDKVCDWLTPDLATAIGATGPAQPGTLGCVVPVTGHAGDTAQIAWTFPFQALHEPTHFARPATVHGLQARQFALHGQGPGECTTQVNTRSAVSLHLVVWNPTDPAAGDHEARCATALRTAEVLTARYVPLAGGTPYPGTPQQPDPARLAKATACDVVTKGAANLANLDNQPGTPGTEDNGDTTCYHTSPHAEAHATLTTRGADRPTREIIGLPADLRPSTDPTDLACTMTINLSPDHHLRLTYHITGQPPAGADQSRLLGLACAFVELLAATTLNAIHRAN
ncbi:MAG TPA: hypothetical protein VGD67_08160 [Pseudonocardiaceae bacterium]